MVPEKFNIKETIKKIDFNNLYDHPNILIAARFWEDDRYQAAKVCYEFMRKIDDMIDDRKAKNTGLSDLEKQVFLNNVNNWINSLKELPSEETPIRKVHDTINRFKIPIQYFYNFAKSMIYDIHTDGFTTVDDFLNYAEGASVAPASVFVYLCCLQRNKDEYIAPSFNVIDVARPCAIFSYLVHIIRDFQKDQHHNLNYFAIDVLKEHGLIPEDLKKISNGAPIPKEFRDMINVYYKLAEKYKSETKKNLDIITPKLKPRYSISLHIIYNLYLQVFELIDIYGGSYTTKELNPTPDEIKARVMEVINAKA